MTRYIKGVSIYKPKKRSRRDDPYLIAYKNPATKKREIVSASTDLSVTLEKAGKIRDRLERVRLDMADPKEEGYAAAKTVPITQHIEDFAKHLRADNNTEKYVKASKALCVRVFHLAGIDRIGQLAPSKVKMAIKEMNDAGLSLKGCNHAIQAVKSFGYWLVKAHRTPENPIREIKKYNADTDRRRRRRALADAEVLSLLASVNMSSRRAGLWGPDRAMLYRVALGTGFRLGELKSLVPESFDLDHRPPTVTVEATASKHRHTDVQPIRDDLAAMLREWLKGKQHGRPVFPMKPWANLALAVKWDLGRAGIPYRDKSNHVADFHSFRHTYITRLVRAGNMKAAQDLARHSTITLTASYSHMGLTDHMKALDSLPSLDAKKPENTKKIG